MFKPIVDSDIFHSHVSKKESKINFSYNCDSLNVLYLFDCVVCVFQYVSCTGRPFRLRSNKYTEGYRRFMLGSSVPQMDFFRQCSEEGYHGFLEDTRVKTIDRLHGKDRINETFWQHKPETFTPQGLNVREINL